MLIYSIGIALLNAGTRIVALFNRKARLQIKGHNSIFKTLKNKVVQGDRYLWFHASSLGEFEQGRIIMETIRRDYPQYRILLTFYSPSGYEVRKNYDGADIVCYMPFDLKFNARRFLNLCNIEKAFFIKYEFWPNFLRELSKRSIQTYSVSSIFRKDQYIFKKTGRFMRRALKTFTHFYVQDSNSKELLESIGINRVTIVGDTRADRVIQIAGQAAELPLVEKFASDCKVFIAGSSWPADEELFIPLMNQRQGWKMIIAPHVIDENHLKMIEGMLEGRRFARYSGLTADSDTQNLDCLIIDCFGLLSSIYRYGNIAYIGGGFGAGIHNTLEAAVYGIPVIFGPNNKRFREALQLIEQGGGFEITDSHSLRMTVDKFISDPAFLEQSGKAAGDYVMSNNGVSERIVASLNL